MNAYTWNLEKRYRLLYLQSRDRDTDLESKYMHTMSESEEREELGVWDGHIYANDTINYLTEKTLLYSTENST